jgi:hypothetical protein
VALICHSAIAQSNTLEYSRVKIDLSNTDISVIAGLGLEADHGVYAKGKHLINDFSNVEIAILEEAGIPFEIQIADVVSFYRERSRASMEEGHDHEHNRSVVVDCDGNTGGDPYDYVTPENYEYGSMGGYLTYDEMLATLDEMAALYPDLISVKAPIGEILTHEARPIYWLRLSDNASVDEDEPEVLYTAVHHAREANSLSQLVFYLWYMLENYESDAEVQYLMDNTEMYFIPCVNPDGYIYNETIEPDGGGLWRKNRYEEDGTVYGVDLNRNYGYEWGFNNSGSSPNPDSQVFRGPSAFSEPETQAVRDFCNAHAFKICLNYHTYGNLLIYPWGFSDTVTDEDEAFSNFADVLAGENDFLAGTASETVGYSVNGVSDDWMYGEMDTKPAIYSMTPEVGPGNFGFWPPQSAIDELNKSTVLMNLTTPHLVLNYGQAIELDPNNSPTELEGTLTLQVKKYGLLDGDLSLVVTGLEAVTSVMPTGANSWTMTHLQEETASFDYVLNSDLFNGEEIRFLVAVDNGAYAWTDTLTKVFSSGAGIPVVADNGENIAAWTTTGEWGTTTSTFFSEPSSYTDSPIGDYDANENTSMTLSEPFDLSNAIQASLNYYAKWDIENNYDYAQVMASSDGLNFTALCGLYTNPGVLDQNTSDPLYDGTQADWVLEEVNLEGYLGEETVWIRFRLYSDGGVEEDGFYFDDLSVTVIQEPSSVAESDLVLRNVLVYPNPAKESLKISFNSSQSFESFEIRLADALGKTLIFDQRTTPGIGEQQFMLDMQGLQPGVYFVELIGDGVTLAERRVVRVN